MYIGAINISKEMPSCPAGTYAKAFYRQEANIYGDPVNVKYYECVPLPGYSQPAQSPITVTTVVPTTTEVSPQVSPQFIQQQDPTNSPVGVELRKDTEANKELIDLLRQMQEEQAPQAQPVYIPPSPATPEAPFTPSGEKQVESPGLFGIPTEYVVAAAILGAALIGRRVIQKRKGK